MKLKIYHHSKLITFIWALIIFILCATPGQYIPSASWLDLLSIDKLVHAGIFFILCNLFLITAIKNNYSLSQRILIVFICVIYGASLEWMQATLFVNRSADWFDIIANTAGCLLALSTYNKLNTKLAAELKEQGL